MLHLLDLLFTLTHIFIIAANLYGWIWKRTRKLHLWLVFFTLASWLGLGIKYGLGYCFLTDWHWELKNQLGETDLPNSFVLYLFQEIGVNISSTMTDFITAISFALAIGMSLYFNFFKKTKK